MATPGQGEPGSNGKGGALHIFQRSRTGASPTDKVECNTQNRIHSILSPADGLVYDKYSYHTNNLHGFKHSYLILIIYTQLYHLKVTIPIKQQ